MPGIVELLGSRRMPHVAMLALMSLVLPAAALTFDAAFTESLTQPFATQPEATGSVAGPGVEPRTPAIYASAGAVPTAPRPADRPQSYAAVRCLRRRTRTGLLYAAGPPIETTGTVAPRSVAAIHAAAPPTSPSLSVPRYARKIGAPLSCDARSDFAGQWVQGAAGAVARTAIDHSAHVAAVAAAPAVARAVAAPAVAAAPPLSRPSVAATASFVATTPSVHVVNPGDTLHSIAHRHHMTAEALAKANNLDVSAKLKLGTRLNVPAAKSAAVLPAAATGALPVATAAAPAAKTAVATAAPSQSARLVQPSATVEASENLAKPDEAVAALPTFRWPVRGKVITSYGAKTNGKANDGINLAVPEGTPVKAAEDGVVAYSGNELKGYGNLILVRHANGYVTAYAHASELLVKRGDTIKRGQVIAKSGQSGEVASPQLHFEIRRGSTPVDPLQFLNGA